LVGRVDNLVERQFGRKDVSQEIGFFFLLFCLVAEVMVTCRFLSREKGILAEHKYTPAVDVDIFQTAEKV